MSRHHTDMDLDPQIAAELAALEAALAGDDSADPALRALVADVREDAAGPTLAFREDLDARVAAGFPRRRGPSLSVPAWLWARRTVTGPALGLAAAVIVALVVSLGTLRSGDDATTFSSGASDQAMTSTATTEAGAAGGEAFAEPAAPSAQQDSAARPKAAPEVAASASTVAPAPTPVPAAPVLGRAARKVERTTQLSLRTNARGLQKVSDGIVRVTQAAGGVVQESSVDATDRGGSAEFSLTVPTAKADTVVARLSRLASVASMSQQTSDITAAFVNFRDLLADARAERQSLLRALKRAETAEGIARLRSRIAASREEIARLEGQLKGIESRAATTTIAVSLTARGGAAPVDRGDAGGSWTPGDAAGDALRVLEVGAGVLLIALAVMVPLGVIALPAWLGARTARRRRRESALDPA